MPRYKWTKENHPINKNRELFCERSRQNMIKMQQEKHKWKNDIKLTIEQEEIIFGSLLGDMTIWIPPKAKNAMVSEEHSIKQMEYLKWKENELKSLIKHEMTTTHKTTIFGEIDVVRISSMCLPCLTEIEKIVKKDNKKEITKKWIDKCGKISLAVWMMDDGSSKTNGQHQFDFAIGKINDKEIQILQEWLKTKFDIETTIDKGRPNNRRLRVTGKKNLENLYDNTVNTIKEIPLMTYKLEFMIYNEPCTHTIIKEGRCKKCGRIVSKTNCDHEKHIDEEKLIQLYTTTNKTIKELSVIFKISETTIYNKLKKLGIKTNTKTGINITKLKKVEIDKQWLEKQHITNKKTQYEIADILNTSQPTISKKLKQYNIKK